MDDILIAAAKHQDCLKGTELLNPSLIVDTKYPKRRLRSAKTKLNIWGFTSPKANGTLVQKEKKLSAQSQL
jgi:hypothetical protein